MLVIAVGLSQIWSTSVHPSFENEWQEICNFVGTRMLTKGKSSDCFGQQKVSLLIAGQCGRSK